MSGLGHNRGPSMEPGLGWRRHCWKKARADLLPTLPLEVVRRRVARARALGLDYKTYASIRAASGHDVVAFLFSCNALQLHLKQARAPRVPDAIAGKLADQRDCDRLLSAYRPLDPQAAAQAVARQSGADFRAAFRAPDLSRGWGDLRGFFTENLTRESLRARQVLVVGCTGFERDWSLAGRMAGYLAAERYFPAAFDGSGQTGGEGLTGTTLPSVG